MNSSILYIAVAFGGALQGQRFWALALGDSLAGGVAILPAIAAGFWLGGKPHHRLKGPWLALVPLLGLWTLKGGLLLGLGHGIWLVGWVLAFTTVYAGALPPKLSYQNWIAGLAIGGCSVWLGQTLLFAHWFVAAGLVCALISDLPLKKRVGGGLALAVLTIVTLYLPQRTSDGSTVAQSPFTRWVLQSQSRDSWDREAILFGNGVAHFESDQEPGSLQCLSRIPLEWLSSRHQKPKRVVVIGPELGMVVRELVESPLVEKVIVVSQDTQAASLALHHPGLRTYNRDSLHNQKVTRISQDPFRWIHHTQETFDAILVALPTPRTWNSSRHFSAEFYSALLLKSRLIAVTAGSIPEGEELSPWVAALKRTFLKLGRQPRLIGDVRSRKAYFLVPSSPSWDANSFFEEHQMLPSSSSPQVCQHNPHWKSGPASPLTLQHVRLPPVTKRYLPSQWRLLPE